MKTGRGREKNHGMTQAPFSLGTPLSESKFVLPIVCWSLLKVITMDLDDLSISSIEDEQCNKGTSSMKSESGNEGIHLPISINKTSTQSNSKRLQKYDETGYSAEVTKRSRSKVQNEILKVQDGGSSVCTIGKNSTSNTSSMVGNEILKTSQSMLSFTSTDATCGSSSSNSISSEDELLDDLEEISKRCETEDVSDLEQPILGLPHRAVGNVPNPTSTASFSGIDVGSEFQTTDCGFAVADRSSLPEDSNSLKSPEMCNSLDAVDLPSLPKGRLSNHFKSDEFPSKICFSSTLASDKPSDIEELSSNKNAITVPRLLGKAPPLNIRKDETSMIPDSGAIGGFHDYDCNRQNYCQKEDKSVRRKVRREPPTSSNSLPNRSSAPSATSSPKKVGRSLLKICKSLEKTSHEEDDWDINETYSRSVEMEHFTPNSWAQELISFCYRTQNADTTSRLDTESILKEVRHFFQNNRVEADENLSWKQNKFRILTSKYFSGWITSDQRPRRSFLPQLRNRGRTAMAL
ncbi:hypothetical protein AVEN_84876-1 [Araneus ventricosus]|uniref:Uncharacterized protein n=1 Tax=Araneus ventricosus TaxID=182803 RepID=A0A4Y2R7Z7_ARAVE|nr:hypothetical protein AVEN_84876-1 [Araneus ventricosus]